MTDVSDSPVAYGGSIASRVEETMRSVLPIGGVKQKVLAVHRAGLREIILPERTANDLDDVPEEFRDEITFHTPADIETALGLAHS